MKQIIKMMTFTFFIFGASSAFAEELPRKELEAIGERYIQAWKSGNLDELEELFLDPKEINRRNFNWYQKNWIKEIESYKIKDNHILLEFDYERIAGGSPYGERGGGDKVRWLLLTTDGKIKYDSLLIKHPIHIADQAITVIAPYTDNPGWYKDERRPQRFQDIKVNFKALKQSGIPLFGLDINDKPNDIKESLDDIIKWRRKEGDEWDASEPTIYLPKQFYKY